MAHNHIDLPAQRQAGAGVLPVVAAVESARFLREQLDLLPTTTANDRDTLRHELALLRHWLQSTEAESTDYQAVVDGLARFATTAEVLLANANGPDGNAVPAIPV